MRLKKSAFFIITFILATLTIGCANKKTNIEDAYKKRSAQNILLASEKYLEKKNYSDAIKELEALETLYPFGPEAEQAQLDIIYAYYKHENYTQALVAAERYIHLNPRGQYTPYAYYIKGLANLESSSTWLQKVMDQDPSELEVKGMQTAFSDFSNIVKLFPESAYSHDAHAKMVYIRNAVAKRELKVAKFYFNRKAYVASVNRASHIVKHLPSTPQTKEALEIMVKSYRALGLNDLAESTLKILQLNFPTIIKSPS